ncbi:MAG: HAD family phosphatase [Chloroflexota bacterium]|nr:HAD family phosphatase [Chloroflexota bacterium]
MRHLPKAILWDLDGTIIDSTECHYQSWVEALKNHGYSLTRDLFDANFGRNNQTSLSIFLGFKPNLKLANEIIHEKEELFREEVPGVGTLIPGVNTWLTSANQMEIRQAIASSAGMKNITTMLSAFELLGYFDLLVSGENLRAKPEPDVFLAAADLLKLSPEDCVVIEDSAAGIEAAKWAGMACIAVVTSHAKSQLGSADMIVDDFTTPFLGAIRSLGLDD